MLTRVKTHKVNGKWYVTCTKGFYRGYRLEARSFGNLSSEANQQYAFSTRSLAREYIREYNKARPGFDLVGGFH